MNLQPRTSRHELAQRKLDFTLNTTVVSDVQRLESNLIKELQRHTPEEMHCVVSLVPKEDETIIDKIIKSRGSPSSTAPPAKWHRISLHGALTDAEYRQQIKEKEEATRKQPNRLKKKKTIQDKSPESDVDSPIACISEAESSGSLEDIHNTNVKTLDKTKKDEMMRKSLTGQLPKCAAVKERIFYAHVTGGEL